MVKAQDFELIDKFEQAAKIATIGISSITSAELYYGVKKKNSSKLTLAVETFLSPLNIFEFDQQASAVYGDVRTALKNKGTLIGSYDMLIAAHALSLNAILITNNVREFARVSGLTIENWAE